MFSPPPTPPVRAIGLMSGGLDSLLAASLVRDQGVLVLGMAFESPFFSADRARAAAAAIDIPLQVVDFTPDILELLAHPPHGFGSGLNPCIDCHARMLRRADERRVAAGYDFLFTGELLNQRPMSQTRRSLDLVAREAGVAERLVRPLSAQRLPETEVERRGWLDRSRLLGLEGRSRRAHLELAARFGIRDIPPVAGGCCLAEPNFANRLRDLRCHGRLQDLEAVRLLFHGRHFRLGPTVKLVIGRNEADNAALLRLRPRTCFLLRPAEGNGPTALLDGAADAVQQAEAASLVARYLKAGRTGSARLAIAPPDGGAETLVTAAPMDEPRLLARAIR